MKRNIKVPKQRPAPLIPEGAEVWIGLFFAVLTFLYTKNSYEPWMYIILMTLVYAFCIYVVNILTDDYRMWAKTMKKRNTVLSNLEKIEELIPKIRDANLRDLKNRLGISFAIIAGQLQTSINISYDAVNALDDLDRTGVQYTGFDQLFNKTGRMLPVIVECVDILYHPSKAGKKLDEKIKSFVEGFDGYADWVPVLCANANSGDLFNATTNALLLRSLRNLLKKEEE